MNIVKKKSQLFDDFVDQFKPTDGDWFVLRPKSSNTIELANDDIITFDENEKGLLVQYSGQYNSDSIVFNKIYRLDIDLCIGNSIILLLTSEFTLEKVDKNDIDNNLNTFNSNNVQVRNKIHNYEDTIRCISETALFFITMILIAALLYFCPFKSPNLSFLGIIFIVILSFGCLLVVHDNIETLICKHIKKYKSLQNERENIHDTCYNYINDLYNKLQVIEVVK